ncbi:MAG TPA: UTP--glucose-1-phosphate uridylyltransferase GalU [Methylophilus sp.]|nr:UTP--glucose-1-phosphate uridylyltransferase GalU [Methylophilus sp.]HQQ33348.1 UTP--glucose-1-phosphate uridylyltransferase GalU [Methylophilus sp.]
MVAISKAVFPVAGLGTRFLPATKASPKEMLPIVDKPLIQYAAEEAIAAGATELIFITGRNKRSIEDHFDNAAELEASLEASGKTQMLEALKGILPSHVSCIFIRQPKALGLGHAVLCAKPVVGDAPFSVILADDLIDADVAVSKQMAEVYANHKGSVLGVEDVAPEETASYGIVDAYQIEQNLLQLKSIVEKPKPADAPSTLAVVGRYILTPRIFECLEHVKPGKGGEIQLTDGISDLLTKENVYAYRFTGKRYDCGSKLGFMKANVELAMKHPEIAQEFAQYLKTL